MIINLVRRFPMAQKWIPTGPFAQRVTALAGGTVAAQAVALLITPILTRLYSAAAFGNQQLYLSLLMFVSTAAALRYEFAIFLPEDDETAAHVTIGALLMVCATTALVALGVLLCINHPSWLGQFSSLGTLLWWLVVGTAVVGIYQVLTNWSLRRHAYKWVAISRFTQAAGQMGGQLFFGLLHWNFAGLIAGDVVGRSAASSTVIWRTWRHDLSMFRKGSWQGVKQAMSRYIRFPTVALPATLINNAGGLVPPLGLGLLFGPQVLGWYALTDRALGVPTMLVGQAISQVFMASAGGNADQRDATILALFRATAMKLAIIGIVPYLIVALWGPWLFSFVFGQEWRVAGQYAQVLALPQFIGFVVWPLLPTLTLIERQDVQLVWDCLRLIVLAGTIALSQWLAWSSLTTVAALGAMMGGTWLLHFAISYILLRQRAANPLAPV
jgi:O-antigen/teichoic acid export membrane protein